MTVLVLGGCHDPFMAKYPAGLPESLRKHWDAPWTDAARRSGPFRSWLHRHGYLTPHFTLAEARCKDPQRTPIPDSMVGRARTHAFNLERLRHELGDKPLPTNSWYRTPAWNEHVGGAKRSQHMRAVATDFTKQLVDAFGHHRFFAAANLVFVNGGVGEYPGGAAHVDSRGYRARWTSF